MKRFVRQKENEWIEVRRKEAGIDPGTPDTDAWGLAFSGGGIRSAIFNLGVLQAFRNLDLLKTIDYLSTVSGGGYIGSSLTWFKHLNKDEFPFGYERADHDKTGGKVLAWLRAHGNYLTPDRYLNIWSLLAAFLTAILINLAILVPVFLLLIYGLTTDVLPDQWQSVTDFIAVRTGVHDNYANHGFLIALALATLSFLLFFFLVLLVVVLSRIGGKIRGLVFRRRMWHWMGLSLMIGLLLTVIGTLPLVYASVQNWIEGVSLASAMGFIAMMVGKTGRWKGNETRGWRSLLLSAGLSLAVYGLALLAYHVITIIRIQYDVLGHVLLAASAGSLILALITSINRVSMHRYYRNRLMEAFMPEHIAEIPNQQPPSQSSGKPKNADQCLLSHLKPTSAPYHIINATLQTMGSKKPKLRQRRGENFILSPLYCGSDHTNYLETEQFDGNRMNLATAMAISGAAVDPNTLMTQSRPLSFLMSFFNLRLGFWIVNPKHHHNRVKQTLCYYYIFKELFGVGLDEDNQLIHLTDGGHFENLGLYELVRRKCKTMIICDAGADPQWTFSDLATAIELVRVDFGARIEINIDKLKPVGNDRLSPQPLVRGKVIYKDNSQGELFYIKTCMIDRLPEDINGYRRTYPDFPDQSTADQFFSEKQFEAYRELGFQLGIIAGKEVLNDRF